VALNSAQKVLEAIRGAGAVELNLELERAGAKQQVKVTPTPVEGEGRPMIGVQFDNDLGIAFTVGGRTALVHPGPVEQLYKAGMSIVDTVGAVASKKSDVKLQHMGGPVMMMRVYYSFFQMDFADGWRLAFWFSVVLNINLAMLNMLPIPVLDGGHIVLAIIEGIRRRPVSLRILEMVQTGCAVMIIGFMVYIFFFDVQDLFQGSGQKKLRPKAASSEAQK
jgi:regulator of sigma E protease